MYNKIHNIKVKEYITCPSKHMT